MFCAKGHRGKCSGPQIWSMKSQPGGMPERKRQKSVEKSRSGKGTDGTLAGMDTQLHFWISGTLVTDWMARHLYVNCGGHGKRNGLQKCRCFLR